MSLASVWKRNLTMRLGPSNAAHDKPPLLDGDEYELIAMLHRVDIRIVPRFENVEQLRHIAMTEIGTVVDRTLAEWPRMRLTEYVAFVERLAEMTGVERPPRNDASTFEQWYYVWLYRIQSWFMTHSVQVYEAAQNASV